MVLMDSILNGETDFYEEIINKLSTIHNDFTGATHPVFQHSATPIHENFSNQSSQQLKNTTVLYRASAIIAGMAAYKRSKWAQKTLDEGHCAFQFL